MNSSMKDIVAGARPFDDAPNATQSNSTAHHHQYYLFLDDIATAELILILLLNTTLILFLLSTKSLRKQQSAKLFMNLQVVHILLAVIFLVRLYKETYQTDSVIVYLSNGLLVEMFVGLQVCTMDRFVAIKYPYHYKRLQSTYTNLILMIMWAPAFIFTIAAIVREATDYQMYVIRNSLISSAAIVLIISNIMVYFVAKKHYHALNRLCVRQQRDRNQEEKLLKSTYVCLCIVFSFVVLWMPLFVHNFLYLHFPENLRNDDENFTYIVEIVAVFNSVLDPILFVLFRKDVKKALRARNGAVKKFNFYFLPSHLSIKNLNAKCKQRHLNGNSLHVVALKGIDKE